MGHRRLQNVNNNKNADVNNILRTTVGLSSMVILLLNGGYEVINGIAESPHRAEAEDKAIEDQRKKKISIRNPAEPLLHRLQLQETVVVKTFLNSLKYDD